MIRISHRGFTIFFAVLTASLALAVGISIFELTIREIDLSTTATQSQFAIYAADTGAECALYWDSKCTLPSCRNGSAFATSTSFQGATLGAGVMCNTQDISTTWVTNNPPPTSNTATTTFTMQITAPLQTYCATVEVGKFTDSNGVLYTHLVSHGYNVCPGAVGPTRLERALQVNY